MKLIDTTLREGEQLFKAYFDRTDKENILAGLAEAGVDEVETGFVGQEDIHDTLSMARNFSFDQVSLWSPLRRDSILKALELCPDILHISVPVSRHHIGKRLHLTPSVLLHRLRELLLLTADPKGPRISLGLEDASRADEEFLFTVIRLADALGVYRVRLSDTVGAFSPSGLGRLVSRIKSVAGCALGVHCHNDFGMATANVITAMEHGADYGDVSVLGIGERSGIARLEEVLARLVLVQGRKEYRLAPLQELAALVSRLTTIPIERTRPILGPDIFASETGIHVHGLLRDPVLFEPFPPESVGGSRAIRIGKKSGKAAVKAELEKNGTELQEDLLQTIVDTVRKASQNLGRPLEEKEFRSLSSTFEHTSIKCKPA